MTPGPSHGYLPAGRYIVNHDIMHCTAEGVSGNDLYSGRALGLTETNDYIQLHPDLKPLWDDITSHYGRIGLSHSNKVIWDLSLEQLAAFDGYRPSVFYFGPAEGRVWHDPECGYYQANVGTSDLYFCDRVIDGGYLKKAGWPKIARKRWPILCDTSFFCKHIDLKTGRTYPAA